MHINKPLLLEHELKKIGLWSWFNHNKFYLPTYELVYRYYSTEFCFTKNDTITCYHLNWLIIFRTFKIKSVKALKELYCTIWVLYLNVKTGKYKQRYTDLLLKHIYYSTPNPMFDTC
jgi:hypothetical protein